MESHTDKELERMFRLDRATMEAVMERIGHLLVTGEPEKGRRACGHAIVPEQRLAVALRFLAGGSVLDIQEVFRPMSTAEVYESVWMVVDAINNEYKDDWAFPLPKGDDDVAADKELAVMCTNQPPSRGSARQNCRGLGGPSNLHTAHGAHAHDRLQFPHRRSHPHPTEVRLSDRGSSLKETVGTRSEHRHPNDHTHRHTHVVDHVEQTMLCSC